MTARTIATLEERWALPRGTVIRDAAGVAWVKRPVSWMATTPIEDDQWIGMPATVLHDPSTTAPSPSVMPEAAVEAATAAVRRERAFAAAAAFGVPLDAVPECAEMIARAALAAALPLLTAVPSATREEVGEALHPGLFSLADYEYARRFDNHGAEARAQHQEAVLADEVDPLLARFNITPKEDR